MRFVERLKYKNMNESFTNMLVSLERFKVMKEDLKLLQDRQGQELMFSSRLIKKEVIDVADMIEDM